VCIVVSDEEEYATEWLIFARNISNNITTSTFIEGFKKFKAWNPILQIQLASDNFTKFVLF
jgi:hypothetical protein